MKENSNMGEIISGQEMTDKTVNQNPEKKPVDPARRPRRASGPQIYGQGDQMPDGQGAYGQQGMIRREVPARGTGSAPVRPAGQPMDPNGAPVRPARQPMSPNGAPTRPAGQPMNANGAPTRPAGQPMNANGAPTRPAGQPMNPNGAPVRPAGQPMSPNGAPVRPAGQPMNANGAPVRPAGQPMNPNGAPQNRPPMGMPMVHPGRRMEAAREALKSPLLILIALLNTVCLAGAVAAIFMDQMNYSQFIRLISDVNMPAQAAGYMDSVKKVLGILDSGMITVNLALHLPELFLCLGLWLVCINVRTADEKMSGIGFLFMKIFVVINMVVTCVLVLAGLILSVTLVVAAWVSSAKSMIVIAAVMLVAMIVIALAAIMYYFCYLATIKVCKLNAAGEPYGQASAYVALVHVIFGLTGIVGLLSGIVNEEISNIAGSIGKIGWMILFALWIILYRRKMSEFED